MDIACLMRPNTEGHVEKIHVLFLYSYSNPSLFTGIGAEGETAKKNIRQDFNSIFHLYLRSILFVIYISQLDPIPTKGDAFAHHQFDKHDRIEPIAQESSQFVGSIDALLLYSVAAFKVLR